MNTVASSASRPALLSRILGDPRSALGFTILIIVVVTAVLGPFVYPYSPVKPDYMATLAAPSARHTRRCPARQSACEQAVPQYQATRHFEHRWLPAPCLAAGPPSPARLAQRR